MINSYDEIVAVSVTEPVYVTKYKWCLDIPPRCPDNKQEFRTVQKNIVSNGSAKYGKGKKLGSKITKKKFAGFIVKLTILKVKYF